MDRITGAATTTSAMRMGGPPWFRDCDLSAEELRVLL
jgi:hypothetical protein